MWRQALWMLFSITLATRADDGAEAVAEARAAVAESAKALQQERSSSSKENLPSTTKPIASPPGRLDEMQRYKAYIYRKVGVIWYHKVNQQFQVLPLGMVHIQFTIHSDGSVDTKVLKGDTATMQLLISISLYSIRKAAPFNRFTPSMIKKIGQSYTDDFTFSINDRN